MSNQELLEKLKEDMEMRGFSHYTKVSHCRKAKETIEYFKKPIEEVITDLAESTSAIIKVIFLSLRISKEEIITVIKISINKYKK